MDYSLQIDAALALLAEKITELSNRLDTLSQLPNDIVEAYSKAKIVEKYVAIGVPVQAALMIVGIEVQIENSVPISEVTESYQASMRSLQSSIEALKAVFDYSKEETVDLETVGTEEEGEEEEEENEETETSEHKKDSEKDTTDTG